MSTVTHDYETVADALDDANTRAEGVLTPADFDRGWVKVVTDDETDRTVPAWVLDFVEDFAECTYDGCDRHVLPGVTACPGERCIHHQHGDDYAG